MVRKIKSAIVGCGSVAQVHAKSIEKSEDAYIVAVADCVVEKADKMAAEYRAKAYSNLEEMLEKEEIDVLHICTPHYLHTPMAISALKKGIHVFMEKPPVINFTQWEQLKKEVKDAEGKVKLGVCFQNRYNNSVCYVKEHLEKGDYGKILGARAFVTWCREEKYYTESGWRGALCTEGGGVLINQSIHTLDLLQYFIGEKPLVMDAVTDTQHLKGIIEVEDTIAAHIIYPEVRACFYASNGHVCDSDPLIELECEKARVRIEDMNVIIWKKNGEEKRMCFEDHARLGKGYWGAGHLHAIHDFYHCIQSKDKYALELDEIEDTIWLMLEAYRTADSKKNKK